MTDHTDRTDRTDRARITVSPHRPPRPGVLDRMTLIMDTFADSSDRLVLEDITQISGLPRSTVFRMLRQLVQLGWVTREGRQYSPGPRLTRHATRSAHESLRIAAAVPLSDLGHATGYVAHLAVFSGQTVLYLDKVGGGEALQSVPSRIGHRLHAHEAVCGLAMLAWLAPEDVDGMLPEIGPARAVELHRDLAAIRHRGGLAWSDGTRRPSGISSVGAAVRGPHGPVAAISVTRRGALAPREVGPLLLATTRTIGRALYPGWTETERATQARPA